MGVSKMESTNTDSITAMEGTLQSEDMIAKPNVVGIDINGMPINSLPYIPAEPIKPPKIKVTEQVTHPGHYNQNPLECIDAIEGSMSTDEFAGFLKGNVLKYLWRYKHKGNPIEDLKKAEWYLAKLREVTTNQVADRYDP